MRERQEVALNNSDGNASSCRALVAEPYQEKLPIFAVSDRWLIDSGAGKHFVSRESVQNYQHMIEQVPSKTFTGAQGNFRVSEQIPILFEGIVFKHYVKSGVPSVCSLGVLVANGFSFVWLAGKEPILTNNAKDGCLLDAPH